MIGRLTGTLLSKEPPLLWLDVHGVGYELEAPMSTFYGLPEVGQSLTVHTHFSVREDNQTLYAFARPAEKALFRQLIKVSGVGPKAALVILSGISAEEFWDTIRNADSDKLTRLPGVGKKTAERLVVDLRDKADKLAASAPVGVEADAPLGTAIHALVSLGYRPVEARRMAESASAKNGSAEDIIREALRNAMK